MHHCGLKRQPVRILQESSESSMSMYVFLIQHYQCGVTLSRIFLFEEKENSTIKRCKHSISLSNSFKQSDPFGALKGTW